MKTKRILVILVLVSICMSMIFAQAQAENKQPEKNPELTIMMHPVLYAATGGAEGQITKFSQETGIKVEVLTGPLDQILEKTLLDFVSDSSTIDIFSYTDTAMHSGLADYLLPLDSYISSAKSSYDFKDILKSTIDLGTFNGKVYGVPFRYGVYMLYYRIDLFEKYGVQVPETWDEFLDAAKRITEGLRADGISDVYGLAYTAQAGQYVFENYKTWLAGFGGFIADKDRKVRLDDPQAIAALKAYMAPYKNGWASPNTPAQPIDEVIAAFQKGKAAMALVYSPYWGLFTNPATSTVYDKVGWALTPHAEGVTPGRSSFSGWNLLVNNKTEYPDAAWQLIEYLTSKENMLEQASKYSNGPVRTSVLMDAEYLAKFPVARGWAEGLQASEPILPGGHAQISEIMDIIGREVSNAFIGKKTPEKALADAQAQVEAFFK